MGDLRVLFYNHFLATLGDPDVAALATAAVINDLLADEPEGEEEVSC